MFKRSAAAKVSIFVSVLVFLLAASAAFSQSDQQFSINTSPLPAPTGFVNDYAGVIDAATKQQLEQKIKNFRDSSNPSTELAVAVVRSTGDRDIFDYSLAVARGWKIGSKEDDNPSALLFVAIDDRKYFTQVSRDLEDELPDALVGSLQRQFLVPEFKKGNYAKGISDTIDAYIRTINQRRGGVAEATPTPDTSRPVSGSSGTSGFGCCIGLFVLLVIVMILSSRGRGGRGGSGWGGGGGFGGALPWIIGSMIANSGSSRSSSSDWGGFGGGGGGFGGFGGGGDFGGGGAGGSW